MRLGEPLGKCVVASLALCTGLLFNPWDRAGSGAPPPQGTTVLAPDASAAKAREVIQRSIHALGGPAYLDVHDLTRISRFSAFDHNGTPRGTLRVVSQVKLPDKERTEYIYKTYFDAVIAVIHKTNSTYEVHNGDDAWSLTGGGVEELASDMEASYRDRHKKSVDVLFRRRLTDPELVLRYTGIDTVDLRQVDWIEASDTDRFVMRIAIDHSTHLPLRVECNYRDPVSNDREEERELFSNYQLLQGIQTPMQVTRERNGRMVSQLFVEDVKYNTGLSDSLFTKESLDQLCAKICKK